MQKWINFLRGSAAVEVTGAFPERFLNLCAQEGIGFWGLETPDSHTLRLRVSRRDVKRLEPLARRVMCEVTVRTRSGMPFFLARFRRRYALLVGLALSLCAVGVLSQFILTVDVQGNETVPTAAILEELKRLGVRPGAYGPSIEENQVCNEALLNLKDLAWISVNLHGTRAEVLVRERTPKPEIVDESIPTHVVADGSGIITQLEVHAGQALFQEGDTVVEGEVIISGIVDLKEPLYSEIDLGTMTVHAAGKVYARTWRTLSAVLPLEADVKEYTGEEDSRWSLTFFGHRLQFYKNGGISYERYDKIKNNHTLTLPGGREMPLTLTQETVREYGVRTVSIDAEAGEELLRQRLEERLEELMQEREGEVLQTEFTAVRRDGMLTVTLVAECSEQIGKTVEFEGRIGRNENTAVPEPEESTD
ncbi:MAG: sporulation protein YqfD [Oscillospiraceae bacterium]